MFSAYSTYHCDVQLMDVTTMASAAGCVYRLCFPDLQVTLLPPIMGWMEGLYTANHTQAKRVIFSALVVLSDFGC